MTMQPLTESALSGNRLAGRLAVISGVFGIAAFACLIAFLVMRPSEANQQTSHFLLRTHDAGIILQSLCLIPFVLALDAIVRQHSPGLTRGTVAAAIIFLVLIVVLMLLSFVNIIADVLYMIPQGALGVMAHRRLPAERQRAPVGSSDTGRRGWNRTDADQPLSHRLRAVRRSGDLARSDCR